MGLYDYVDYEMPCPNCGTVLSGNWQSKDGDCCMGHVKPEEVRSFGAICRHCGTSIDMRVVPKGGVDILLESCEWMPDEERCQLCEAVRLNGEFQCHNCGAVDRWRPGYPGRAIAKVRASAAPALAATVALAAENEKADEEQPKVQAFTGEK